MGYLFLSVALFCGAVKGFCGKKMSNFAKDFGSAARINLLRMVACVLLSFLVVFLSGNATELRASYRLILISALSGVSTAAFIVTWLLSVRKSAYMMLDVFLMLGTLVPVISGRFLFGEPIGVRRMIGFAVLVLAVLIMCSYNNSIKAKFTPASFALLVLCGLSNGVTDLSQKIASKTIENLSVDVFNLYTYIFAAVTLLITLLFIPIPKNQYENESTKTLALKPIIYVLVLIMAAALAANSYFKTQAAFYLYSAELYPLSQGMSLILSTFMAVIFFGEKLKLKAIVGIILAFTALMIINL